MDPSKLMTHHHGDRSSGWFERLALNLLSYSIVLVPIAFIVIATRKKLIPESLRSFIVIRLFVYGDYDASPRSSSTLRDDEECLLKNAERARLRLNVVNGAKYKRNVRVSNDLLCLTGLQVSYLIWGYLQEKIMTTEYPVTPNFRIKVNLNETHGSPASMNVSQTVSFHDSQFLVFINRVVAFITAIFALLVSRRRETRSLQLSKHSGQLPIVRIPKAKVPLYEYVYCSVSNIMSSWCQYEALKYVNFPTQCLSKSFKVVPVMLWSSILSHKKYAISDYFCAFLLAVGLFIFMLNQPTSVMKHHLRHHEILKQDTGTPNEDLDYKTRNTVASGLMILALYLTFDSFTSNWQQSLNDRYGKNNWQMMAAVNFYSTILTLTSLNSLGNLGPAVDLLASSSILIRDLLLMSIMSSIGQMFIYETIARFGPVIFSIIMTMRQFFSILLSYSIYRHHLDFGSSVGLVLIILVVIYQAKQKLSRGGKASRDTSLQAVDKT